MPLTPEEQQELAQLSQKYGPKPAKDGIDTSPGFVEREMQNAPHTIMGDALRNAPMAGAGAINPSIEQGIGYAAGKLKNFLAPAAARSEVLSKVKSPTELEPYVQGKINEAKDAFNERQRISTRECPRQQ
jgi:hypothetical protein